MDYPASIKYLESLPSPEKWSLAIPLEIASKAGIRFDYSIIHVAGTNGKGSVCASLASIISNSGHKTGLYTSPHLHKYNERIKVDGNDISNGEFARIISEIRPHVEAMRSKGRCPSVFEALTIAAFSYFSNKGVDFLILETGMGGRLDATNIAPSKIQVITSISLDHEKNLGKTIGRIAREKAGIIKDSSIVVCAAGKRAAIDAISRKCRRVGAGLRLQGRDFDFVNFKISAKGGEFDYIQGPLALKGLVTPLVGEHQLQNAALAIAVAVSLRDRGLNLPNSAIFSGLAKTKWPGRLETLPGKPDILLDGAHNPDGILKLKSALEGVFLKKGRKLVLVIGIMSDKAHGKMVRLITPLADEVIFSAASIDRSASPADLARGLGKMAQGSGKLQNRRKIAVIPDLKNALHCARKAAGKDGLVVITGSIYLVGEARAHLLKS